MLVIAIASKAEATDYDRAALEAALQVTPPAGTLQTAAENSWTLAELLGELLSLPEDAEFENGSAVIAALAAETRP